MDLDTYALCPGGTGKKIKFCCSDILGDLEQVSRLIEGEQITAAFDQVGRLEEKYPGRACLMASRTKLALSLKKIDEAIVSSRAFLAAFPENPMALGQAAVMAAMQDQMQEAASLFDKARAAAAEQGGEVPAELVRIATTLTQAAAQMGHPGFAQSLLEWLEERGLATEEERRILASFLGSSGVPVALRARLPLVELAGDSPWRFEFDTALQQARTWRLSKALTTFRSLKGVAGTSPEVFTNIGVLCEMLARPMEAAEAWLTLANLPGMSPDEAIEATARAIALETEANPERSPRITYVSRVAALGIPGGEEGTAALELLEDKLRHDPACEPIDFDRSPWVARNAAPPRSVWRVYERSPAGSHPPRLLASLLIFGRQTDREPEAVLQGLGPDVEAAVPVVAELLGCRFEPVDTAADMPSIPPTQWLLGGQFKPPIPATQPPPAATGEPAFIDSLLEQQREAVTDRLVALWPDLPLPELLGKTPRQAVADREGSRRVEALIAEGETTSRRQDLRAAWTRLRETLGLPAPAAIESREPLGSLPPARWHRLDLAAIPTEQLRGLFLLALDAGFEWAAERAGDALASRTDATAEDRWEVTWAALQASETTLRSLELIETLRTIAKELSANDGMLDVVEFRVRMQRGDEAEASRLLDHLRREHGRDQRVLEALAQVLAEAGVDLRGMAAAAASGSAAAGGGAAGGATRPAAAPPAAAGKLWTPGGEQPAGGGGEKKIWTPG